MLRGYWKDRLEQQRQDRMVKWGCIMLGLAILLMLALVATSHGQKFTLSDPQAKPSPEFLRMIETHCVAVLTEKHTEKVDRGGISFDPLQEIDKDGNEIIRIPEQTLKLRCR